MFNRFYSAAQTVFDASTSWIPESPYKLNVHWDGVSMTSKDGHGYGLRLSNIPHNLSRQAKFLAGMGTVLTASMANGWSTSFSLINEVEYKNYQLDILDDYLQDFYSVADAIRAGKCGDPWRAAGAYDPQSIQHSNTFV